MVGFHTKLSHETKQDKNIIIFFKIYLKDDIKAHENAQELCAASVGIPVNHQWQKDDRTT